MFGVSDEGPWDGYKAEATNDPRTFADFATYNTPLENENGELSSVNSFDDKGICQMNIGTPESSNQATPSDSNRAEGQFCLKEVFYESPEFEWYDERRSDEVEEMQQGKRKPAEHGNKRRPHDRHLDIAEEEKDEPNTGHSHYDCMSDPFQKDEKKENEDQEIVYME